MRITCRPLLLSVALAALPAAAQAPGAEAELIGEQANAALELEGERTLEVAGLHGRLLLRLSAPGQLRFAARTLEEPRRERPVALWGAGGTLRLAPVAGAEAEPLLVEIGVPPQLAVEVRTAATRIEASALVEKLRLEGADLEITLGALQGAAALAVTRGRIGVRGAAELSIAGQGLSVEAQGIGGPLSLSLRESQVQVAHVAEIDGRIEATDLSADDVAGVVGLRADGGKIKLHACLGGGELILEDTALELSESKGEFEIQTEAAVTLRNHEGSLHVVSSGAAVHALQIQGTLDLDVDNATVALEELGGPTTVKGHDLELQARSIRGDLTIETTASNLLIEGAQTGVVVENEYGDIVIRGASQQVSVSSRNGEVHVEDLKGALELEADGPRVDVSWSQISGWERSSVTNLGGDVRVGLPAAAGFRLEAQAPYGKVENDLPGVVVSQDGHYASATLNAARSAPHVKHPSIAVHAGGDLYLSGGAAPAAGRR